MTRLFVPNFTETENLIIANPLDINYLFNVMRKKKGDHFLVFNQKKGEFLAEVIEISHKKIDLKLINKIREYKDEPEINLIFAPIKHNRMDFLIEKATELGATKLTPILTRHSVANKINIDKWNIYTKEAAEQCNRLSVPEISTLQNLNAFLEKWNSNKTIIFCNEREKESSLINYLKASKLLEANLLVGPEGGFSDDEINLLTSKKFITSIHLGERILRAETACISALAVIGQFLS